MKKIPAFLFLLCFAAPSFAANGGIVDGSGAAENKKWSYDPSGSAPAAPGAPEISEDKKYKTSGEDDVRKPDYQTRGARNAFNGVLTMWGKLIQNALPSDEPLPEKKKEGAWSR